MNISFEKIPNLYNIKIYENRQKQIKGGIPLKDDREISMIE